MTDVIPSTKDRPGSYDAIETAKPGEPLFPIQGGDPFGPPTVQFWVDLCRKAGMRATDPKEAERLLIKARDAEMIGWEMIQYQRGSAPVVEAVPDQRPAYTGWTDPSDEETKARQHERTGRITAAGRLHNAIAAAAEAADVLAQLRACPEAEVKVRESIEALKEAALDVEPRRDRERT